MSIIKLNNRSVKDATAFGSISSLGELTFISKQTASSSATISFTSGIDSTYKEYIFYFVNIHPSSDSATFSFNFSVDGGSNYNVTKTSSFFEAFHSENDAIANVQYASSHDLAQSTDFQKITSGLGSDNDQCCDGFLHLFNPSSTTFVKNFIGTTASYYAGDYVQQDFFSGYGNTTSTVNAVQFKMASGNIDSGDIILFGLN
jgi:hypothetical protein